MTTPLSEPDFARLTVLLQEAQAEKAALLATNPPEPGESPEAHEKRIGMSLLVAVAYSAGQADMRAHTLKIETALQVLASVVRGVLAENGVGLPARVLLETTMRLLEGKVGKEALSAPQETAVAS